MTLRIFELPEDDDRPGAEFAIGDEKFIGKSHMPSGALVNLFYATQATDLARKAAGMVGVIRAALDEEAGGRFEELIYGPREVPLSVLEDVAVYLVEFYTNRPTTPSSGSPAGSTTTPVTPADGSSETDSV